MPVTCQFKIKIHRDKINEMIKTVHLHYLDTIKLDEQLEDIKERVLNSTETYIDKNRRRPSNNQGEQLIDVLRETSFVEKVDNSTYRLGIGNETELDRRVPHWRVVNEGGIPPEWIEKKYYLGAFQDGKPVKGGGGNTWFEGATGDEGRAYIMFPKKPIPAMRYLNYMAKVFSEAVKNFQVRPRKR